MSGLIPLELVGQLERDAPCLGVQIRNIERRIMECRGATRTQTALRRHARVGGGGLVVSRTEVADVETDSCVRLMVVCLAVQCRSVNTAMRLVRGRMLASAPCA